MFEYPKHVGFKCNKCAQCCGDTKDRVRRILLLKMDVDRIADEILLDAQEFAKKTSGFGLYIYEMRKTKNGKCFFLKNNLCTIYKIRPLICRFYPFQLKNLGNNQYSFCPTNKCSGIRKKPPQKRFFFENLFTEFSKAMSQHETDL